MRRRGLHWYDIILVGIAAIMVYPDKVLDWVSDRTGRRMNWLHLFLLELVGVVLMAAAMSWLMQLYPRLHWWHPIVVVGAVAIIRISMWLVAKLFGFDD
jgi:hypothetical protein